jgi:EAL domain-containing protein (putative c-di-GMP-specific phosphodiesterase class I)
MVVSSTLVCAPLGGPGHALGLLLLATERMATSSQVAAALSAAIDFAGVATSLLRPGLEERRREQQQRLGLATVLLEEAFVPHFQPVVELAGDGAIGFEALTRFTDGTSPEARFAEAAKLGLGPELEQATLRAALAKAATLPGGAWLSLNVSPAMILATPTLRQVLRAAERPIVLEISEHEPIDDYAELKVAVDRLGRDVSIAVDDVGSGFASLRHVLILQPSFMKLDPCWIRAVEVDPGRQALIQGLVSFAAKTDCQVIAEGIETEEERAVLVELGVRLGQGFLLGMPKPSLAKVTAAPASR